jgi:hypothetical protein
MKHSSVSANELDTSYLRQTSDGFVDYDFYQSRGRKLQGQAIGDIFRQAGRHMVNALRLAR